MTIELLTTLGCLSYLTESDIQHPATGFLEPQTRSQQPAIKRGVGTGVELCNGSSARLGERLELQFPVIRAMGP